MASSWQDNMTLLESMDYVLTNGVDCDISFKLGKAGSDVVPAHKFVLAIRSLVFRAMLFGPLAEKKSTVESDTFKCFLRYLYTDKCTITADNVTALMYAANKYNVERLIKECGQFMTDNLSTANVCTIMETAYLFDNQVLRQNCLEFIEKHSNEIVKEKLLSDLGQECFGDVLRSDNLKASEEDIFTAVMSWTDRRCTEKDLEVNDSNRRHVLGDLLYLLRFPLMSQEKFVSISKTKESLLSLQEQVVLLHGYVSGNFSKSPFSSKRDRGFKRQYVCYRFKHEHFRNNTGWNYSINPDALSFKVSEPVDVTGLVLFGCTKGSYTYCVHIEIVELGQIANTTVASISTEKTFEVLFSKPVGVQPNKDYTLKVCLSNGPNTYAGLNGISRVMCGDISFVFSTSSQSGNGTDVSTGQIFGIKYNMS
ncbi:BTB/POZ domain-containing protein 6-like [Mizuhopecten yessoensis]|uniref:BTB/POZ domain-containing protein 6 n=1 Tax=Mizuhopecten yessoensis TaxID=6573 RepID=A0A210QE87_MIZYE|nr:BTB/POZ domain-containing protein 6-like [Mizuhopecten yessoensis]XP_021360399.1 BTB/POZ domain-containing protein 6-like [Mizuhopecten yessoensis]XP_021360400.1 BTB/POZ domain-containing protein 6-like [Mizuhopecten yessoensis]OWF47001.1 BTB/POZ domain-containing protein 6 [Mizuhopecten yessoensis]